MFESPVYWEMEFQNEKQGCIMQHIIVQTDLVCIED